MHTARSRHRLLVHPPANSKIRGRLLEQHSTLTNPNLILQLILVRGDGPVYELIVSQSDPSLKYSESYDYPAKLGGTVVVYANIYVGFISYDPCPNFLACAATVEPNCEDSENGTTAEVYCRMLDDWMFVLMLLGSKLKLGCRIIPTAYT